MAASVNDKVIRIKSDMAQALADIHKLQNAYTSLSGVNPALASMVNNLNGAHGATQRVGGAAQAANNNVRSLTGNLGGLGNAANAAMSRLSGMTGTLGGIATAGAALGVTAVAGGLIAIGTAAVRASAQMETYRASLTTILGSSDKASQAMARLVDFAQKTPFSLEQSVEGFTKLKALGLQPTEAAMTSYGNTASAMGKDLIQMIEAVADASTGEFERLKEFGIKSKNEGDKIKFTFQGVTTEVANNSTAIQGYLMGIGNTNFGGAMEKQMSTFNGAMSNLEDTWNQTLAAMGDGALNGSIANVINMITNGLSAAKPILVALGNVMGGVISGVASIASGLGNIFAGLYATGGQGLTFVEGFTVALNLTAQAAQVLGSVLGATFSAVGSVIGAVVGTVKGLFAGLFEWLGVSTDMATNGMGLSFLSVLRAAKFLATNLSSIFDAALKAIGGSFAIVGNAIASFVGGNWNAFDGIGASLKAQFGDAAKTIGGIASQTMAVARDSKGAAAAWERLKGNTGAKGGATLDQLAGAAPPPGKPDADKDAAKKAAERAKREAEYWQALKDQLVTAGMLSNEAEVYNKQLELRKILERDLTPGEKSRVATAMAEINGAKALTALKQRLFEAQNDYTVELGRAKGLTESQRAVEDDLFKLRLDALNRSVDINSAAYKIAEADLRKQLEKNAALKEQAELLKKAKDFAASMSPGARAAEDLKELDKSYNNLLSRLADGSIASTFRNQIEAGVASARLQIKADGMRDLLAMSPTLDRQNRADALRSDYNKAVAQIANANLSPETKRQVETDLNNTLGKGLGEIATETTREWVDQFDNVADYFGGRLGRVLKSFADGFDKFAAMASGNVVGPAGMIAKLLNRQQAYQDGAKGFTAEGFGEAFKNPLQSLSKGFGDFKSMFSGDLATGLTKGLSKLQAGQQIGGMVAGVGALFGANKGFQKGAEIGGTIGGLFGPIGSIVGSLGGGLIGSLFSSAKKGKAVLTGADASDISGNKASVREALTGTAGSIQAGLAEVASALGGDVGAFRVSVGKYKDSFRVSSTGATNVDTKKTSKIGGLIYDGKDEGAAIAAAIKDAIADGAITGIAPLIQKALGKLGTESAIQFAKDWKAAMADYKALTDPIASAVDNVLEPLNALRETMVKVGASAEDLAKMDDYRTAKLKAALKEQLSSLSDFLDQLRGDGSGVTKVEQLNAKLAQFEDYRAKIAAGDSKLDQAEFTKLGQSIFSLAGDIYGTATAEFQDYRAMLTAATQGLSDNITSAFNTAAGFDVANAAADTATAIQAQTAQAAAYYQSQAASNALVENYLKQIASNTNNAGGVPSYKFANDDQAFNGVYGGATW